MHGSRLTIALMIALAMTTTARAQPPDASPERSRDADPPGVHVIAGRVLKAHGPGVPNAIVLLCDQASGLPISRATSSPLIDDGHDIRDARQDITFVTTDIDGAFQIDGLLEGTYRVIAQTWIGTEPAVHPFAKNGPIVTLRGTADNISVPSDAARNLELRPLGTGTLVSMTGHQGRADLLFVSTAPPAGDPILGPLAFFGDFATHIIAYGHTDHGKLTVRGLPDTPVWYFLESYDNIPGSGGGRQVTIPPGGVVPVTDSMVAGWSNARHTPPQRLQPLMEEVKLLEKEEGFGIVITLITGDPQHENLYLNTASLDDYLSQYGDLQRIITLPSGTEATVADLLAVDWYIDLPETAARIKKQREARQRGESKDKTD